MTDTEPRVERDQQLPDRGVQLGDTEEAAVAQGGQDPPLGHQHIGLDNGLIPRLARAGGYDRGAIVLGEVEVRAIDDGLVPNLSVRSIGRPPSRRAP